MEQKSFLIIEDNPSIAAILSIQLASAFADYSTVQADSLRQATFKLQNQKFSLIFLDLILPDGSGTTLVSTIRSERTHPNHLTPIIVVSGSITDSIIQEWGREVAAFISKPWDEKTLLSSVKKVPQ